VRRAFQFILTFLLLAAAFSASAANGKVVKVLPHFLDLKGRHSLSPSLYDRDAYQAKLRQNPALCSGMRFDVLWRGRSATNEMATLRVELRGTAKGDLPSKTSLETQVRITGTGHWARLQLVGDEFKKFGEVTAWRATLWSGDQLLSEQKSFLW
jgi:hypothetical protein